MICLRVLSGMCAFRWPTWLNKQTEKQRIIWAYKVLFLDVLFPLTLKKARASALFHASHCFTHPMLSCAC